MSNATEKMFEVAAANAFENNALNTLTNTVNNIIVGNNRTDLSANDCSLNLLRVDTINEKTNLNGVVIGGVTLKNNGVTAGSNGTISASNFNVGSKNVISASAQGSFTDLELKNAGNTGFLAFGQTGNVQMTGTLSVDTINENTSANGVTIDGVLLKDNGITLTGDISGNNGLLNDLSVNRLYINTVDISGLVHSKQNTLTAGSNITIVGNTINSLAGTGPSGINQTTDVSLNNLKVHGDLSGNDASFNVIDVAQINAFRMNGHILPTSNADFDLGSAEYKIRHLFLSDNSIWIGDNHKMDTVSGTIKLKKRKNLIPKKLREFSPEITIENVKETLNSNNRNINNYEDITLDDWLLYAKSLGMSVNNVNDVFDNIEDFEKDIGVEQDLSGSSLNLNNVNMNNLMLKGIDNANYLNNTSDFKNISNVINNLINHINTLTNKIQELENKI